MGKPGGVLDRSSLPPRRRDVLRATALFSAAGWPPSPQPEPPPAAPPPNTGYDDARRALDAERARLLVRWTKGDRSPAFLEECELSAAEGVRRLAAFWVGTTWGLGAPQIERPAGRVNCGTFVGRLLADAGFEIPVRKLQRQPSALIARTFAPPERVRRFSRVPVARILAAVGEMGTGLYIIGLDYHVGLLVQIERELRFLHASIVTGTVVDEPANTAVLIPASALVVVGKALGPRNLAQWLRGEAIPVVGDF